MCPIEIIGLVLSDRENPGCPNPPECYQDKRYPQPNSNGIELTLWPFRLHEEKALDWLAPAGLDPGQNLNTVESDVETERHRLLSCPVYSYSYLAALPRLAITSTFIAQLNRWGELTGDQATRV